MEFPRPFGPYELLRKIASGGMAEIYLARASGIGGFQKMLVLKMIHPRWSTDEEFISMLVEEAKLAVQLNHANIAQIFDLGLHEGTYYIAMEYLHGKDLFQLLVRTSELDAYLPFDVVAFVAEQISAALHYAHNLYDPYGHSLNLIHRDISPQNIILSFSGEVKLIDFGIAKARVRDSHTQVGIIKGKFYYMSPEQAWGKRLTHLTDIFSLGICLHEMLTGQMVYAEDDQIKLIEKVRRADIPRPSQLRPGVPPELEAIAMRALEPDPANRFQSGYELQRALTEYLHRRSPGFTPARIARQMWELFPSERPAGPSAPGQDAVKRHEFAAARPPESVIFDLNQMAGHRAPPVAEPPPPAAPQGPAWTPVAQQPPAPAPNPAPNHGRSPHTSTAPVQLPDHRPRRDEDVFTGDGHGAHYPIPEPAPSREQHGQSPAVLESTHIVDWDRFKQRHPERSRQLLGEEAPPSRSSGPQPAVARASGQQPSMSRASGQQPSMSRVSGQQPSMSRASGALPALPQSGSIDEDAPTSLYDPSFAQRARLYATNTQPQSQPPQHHHPPQGYPAQPVPSNLHRPQPAPSEQRSGQHAPTPRPQPQQPPQPSAPMSREEKIAAAKARAKANQDDMRARVNGGGGGGGGGGDKPMSREEKIAAAKARAKANQDDMRARVKGNGGGGDKPMTREEKIAAAKARAQANQDDMRARVKGGGGGGGGGGDKPMSREEKIAAAKARAKANQGDMRARVKKKGGDDSGDDKPMSREEKIAAAKARAKAAGKPGSVKPGKPKAEAEASGGSEARRSGRSSRKNKKKKGEPLKGPRIVKGSKGNVDSKVRVARRGRSTSAGEDGEGALATLAALATNRWVAGGAGVLFIVVVFGVYGLYRLVATPEEPDPGHIKITSVPPNARIELNGVDLAANTPFLIDNVQPMTPYAIELNLPNYLPKKRTNIIVQPGETLDLHFTLEPQPGKLVVSTAPPEAEVVINGEVRGVTPATIEGLPRMDDAFVRLTLRKTGFEDATVTLQWKAGTPEITHHETLRAVKKPEKDEDAEGDDEK